MSTMSISNVIESFVPIVAERNYAPTRTFVTKWDVEIENNRTKKIARSRDRDAKYFDYYTEDFESLPITQVTQETQEIEDDESYWELESEDEEGWLQSIHAENADYERALRNNFEWYDMNEAVDTDQGRKRPIFSSEEGDFKRVRA